jgi:hypothetical protein
MFFLIRYQTVVASTREINFARQFSSVNLVHKTETNIARQFFEVCPFIIAVQSFRDALSKRLQSKIALNSPLMAMEIRPGSIRRGEEICQRHRWLSEMNALLDEEGAMGSAMQNGSARAHLQSFAQSRFGA